jgi:dTDP-4-dehydrorhamnose 3,5-epimerase
VSFELSETPLPGLWSVDCRVHRDHRGVFLNVFRAQERAFQVAWGGRPVAQVNVSRTGQVGSIRGLHFQAAPHHDAKLVFCLKGRVWDVVVDLRHGSPTYGSWQALELSADSANALVIPENCAHGFQVLEPDSELLYLHSGPWVAEAERGICWNDPRLAIQWPLPVTELSDRDRALPFWAEI